MSGKEQLYDVIASDGRVMNDKPMSYRDAMLYSADADIDSSDTSTVVPSTRPPVIRWQPWHVSALVGAVVLGVIAATIWVWR
jgi:hypothetical protein